MAMKLYTSEAWKIDIHNPAFQKKLKKNLENALNFFSVPIVLVLLDLQLGRGFEQAPSYFKVWAIGIALDFFLKLKKETTIKQ